MLSIPENLRENSIQSITNEVSGSDVSMELRMHRVSWRGCQYIEKLCRRNDFRMGIRNITDDLTTGICQAEAVSNIVPHNASASNGRH